MTETNQVAQPQDPKVIAPTVGRVVWFTPAANGDPRGDVKQPLVALVAYVWNDRLVNLTVFDQNGNSIGGQTSVPLLQGDDPKPELGYFASWMPYQKGQAAKAEQLAASAPTSQRPSKGRIVHFRDGSGDVHPAVITRVYETGACGLHVLRDDAPAAHSYGAQHEVDPEGGDMGWFWPPRS